MPAGSTAYCERCALDALLATLEVDYPLPEPVEYSIPLVDYSTALVDALLAAKNVLIVPGYGLAVAGASPPLKTFV